MARLPITVVASFVSLVLTSCSPGGGSDVSGPGGTTTEGHRIALAVTGLKGSGAVIQLNGANDVTLTSGNTDAYFTNVAKGTAYAITVKSQPSDPWQTCAIGNGSGTMGTVDVSGVTMDCTTNSYNVRGTIVGLTATGLTLSSGSGTPLSIAPGATSFSFAGILSNNNFAVTIASQPAGQTCSINNGSGRVTSADVTNLAVTCTVPGFTVSGSISGLGSAGLTLSMNGGAALAIGATVSSFSFPVTLQSGNQYGVVITGMPVNDQQNNFKTTCALTRARGKIVSTNVADIAIACRANGTLAPYEGVYALSANASRSFLMILSDGTYSFADRTDDPSCPQNGNGAEYGAYSRTSTGTFSIRMSVIDRNGGCGLWDSQASPAVGASGTMTRSGDSLTVSLTGQGSFVLSAVKSVATSIVGGFTRADGVDGSFVVFEPDGTYLYQETQDSPTENISNGWERGCYVVSGNTFTISLATTCKPNGLPALDLNGSSGFSASNGAAIPFTINSATSVTINGKQYRRLVPTG